MIVGNIGRQIRVHNLYIYEKKHQSQKMKMFLITVQKNQNRNDITH